MKYYSLNHKSPHVSFKEAVINGIAPDKGLYFPESITPLSKSFIDNLQDLDHISIAYEVIKQFVGHEIPKKELKSILNEVLDFDFPVQKIEENIFSLELYHGPTMAFKDVGARFMAKCLSYLYKSTVSKKLIVLVATSGDTGGAVANGFLGVEGIDVVILYPKGKVSDIQEKQLTTLGQNIKALEVEGDFDDCQAMVKKAFLDKDITKTQELTSANSINVARWLPQMFYFFIAYKTLKAKQKDLVFSVPSGNYGNICAGMMAQKLGLPIKHFVTGTNVNDTVPRFLQTGEYAINSTIPTISNAMDVSAPSNFIRIQQLHQHDFDTLKQNLTGNSYTDQETLQAIEHLYNKHNYIADPHGAIGYLAVKEYLKENKNSTGVFLETAHPIKFLPVMPKHISEIIEIPEQIKSLSNRKKSSSVISTYEELKSILI